MFPFHSSKRRMYVYERRRSSCNRPAIRVYTFEQTRVEKSGDRCEYPIIGWLLGPPELEFCSPRRAQPRCALNVRRCLPLRTSGWLVQLRTLLCTLPSPPWKSLGRPIDRPHSVLCGQREDSVSPRLVQCADINPLAAWMCARR